MISIIPSLDFMRSLSGTYKSLEGNAALRISSCGYGLAFELAGEEKTELVGIIGVFKDAVECFAQLGLPNVVRFIGKKISETSIQFAAEDPPFSFLLVKQPGGVRISISLDGQEKVSHLLQAA